MVPRTEGDFKSHMRRRSSILIDMEFPSAGSTRPPSPEPALAQSHPVTTIKEADEDLENRKAAFGSLMKSAKQDVKVPEFDMNAFF